MKTICSIVISLLAGLIATAQTPGPLEPVANQFVGLQVVTETQLTRFDLDFAGGTPAALVKAIEKAMSDPVNVIIPSELAEMPLPAFKVKSVTLPQLFEALTLASKETITYRRTGFQGPRQEVISSYISSYGFRTSGAPSEDAIWYFYAENPQVPTEPKLARFYQLSPFLETYKIEDITTAIQTGWKLLGDASPPAMNFHKETKLLIVVGELERLNVVDSVLQELRQGGLIDRALGAYERPPRGPAPPYSDQRPPRASAPPKTDAKPPVP